MYVKPAPGMFVRNPVTKQHVPPEGMEVPELGPEATYWHRRLRSKELELSQPPSPSPSPAAAPEPDQSGLDQTEVA